MLYQHKAVLFTKSDQITCFLFIGQSDFNEEVQALLTNIAETKNYTSLTYIDYIKIQLNLLQTNYDRSSTNSLSDINLENNLFGKLDTFYKVYFVRQFINSWDTIYTIKQKINNECHSYLDYSLQPELILLDIVTKNQQSTNQSIDE